jgi:hypothetical protein
VQEDDQHQAMISIGPAQNAETFLAQVGLTKGLIFFIKQSSIRIEILQ